MFDIGFSEFAVIGVVALIVIGPEKLPRVARTAGHLLGRLRRYVSDVKSDISREMEMADFKRIQQEVEESARGLQSSLNEQSRELEQQFNNSIGGVLPQHEEVPPASPIAPLAAPSQGDRQGETVQAEQDENQLDLFGGESQSKERS